MDVVVNDDSVNMYGFRILTSGIDLSAFEKNPVMLYDHARREYKNEIDIILPIGKWLNMRKEAGRLIMSPEFDLEDDFAKKIAHKFEKGYLNAASLNANFEAITWSEDPQYMLPGQTSPTVISCMIREVSITDIPGNMNCVRLSNSGKSISLNGKADPSELKTFFSNSNKQIESTMKKTILALNATGLFTLPESATDELVEASVKTIAAQLSAKDLEIIRLNGLVKTAEDKVKLTETAALKSKATSMVDAALSAKKIVAGEKEHLITLASASEEMYKATEESLKLRQPYMSAGSQITDTGLPKTTPEALKTEFTERSEKGTLMTLKAENLEHFKLVYQAGTGKPFKE